MVAAALRTLLVPLGVASLFVFSLELQRGLQLSFTDEAAFLFLPAGVRTLAVLVARGQGVAGIFAGSVIGLLIGPNGGLEWPGIFLIAGISALAPLMALELGRLLSGMPVDLHGLRYRLLVSIVVTQAVISSAGHTLAYDLLEVADATWSVLAVMFFGDLCGAMVVLLLVARLSRWVRATPRI